MTSKDEHEQWLVWGRCMVAFQQWVGDAAAIDGIEIAKLIRQRNRDGGGLYPAPRTMLGTWAHGTLRMGTPEHHLDVLDDGKWEYVRDGALTLHGKVGVPLPPPS